MYAERKTKLTMQISVARLGQTTDKLIARCDEIAACAARDEAKLCNLFSPHESRKSIQLMLDFVAALAEASSASALAASRPAFEALADRASAANDAIASRLPRNCRSLITCLAAGEQFVLNLLLRGDPSASRLAKIVRPLSLALKQILLICFQKLHEQLTVGC